MIEIEYILTREKHSCSIIDFILAHDETTSKISSWSSISFNATCK